MFVHLHRLGIFIAAIAALCAGLIIGGGQWQPALAGLPDAGELASWIRQFTLLLNTLFGIHIVGQLVRLAFLVPAEKDLIASTEISKLKSVNKFAAFWSISNIFSAIFTLQNILGLNFAEAFSPGVIGTYLWSFPPARNFVIAAIAALLISFLATFIRSLNSTFLLLALGCAAIISPLLNSHAATLGDHSLAITSSLAHGLSVTFWVGALWAVLPEVANPNVIKRFSYLATVAVAVLIISGIAAAFARLDAVSDLWSSGYGRLVLIKTVLLIGIAFVAAKIRRTYSTAMNLAKLISTELLIIFSAIGFGVALHGTPLSRGSLELPSAAEEILGFRFPAAPTLRSLVFGWHPEWTIFTGILIALWLYLAGARKLKNAEIAWPKMRTISFTTGLLLVGWATSSGISKFAMVSFASHMIQHMMLSMMAPIFLVLGAPVTLALRALPASSDQNLRNARQWIISLLHSRYAEFIGHPLIVLLIFTFGLYGMYFTPLFGSLMSGHTGHLFMEIHFLLSGFLFAFVVVGVDPAPREVPFISRLLLVLVAISLHAFFAIAIMQSTVPIGNEWYSQVRPPWINNPLDDTYTGGGIAWAIGEIPSLILMVLVAVQWARTDARTASRLDRQADRDGDAELKSYNEYLAKLNKNAN